MRRLASVTALMLVGALAGCGSTGTTASAGSPTAPATSPVTAAPAATTSAAVSSTATLQPVFSGQLEVSDDSGYHWQVRYGLMPPAFGQDETSDPPGQTAITESTMYGVTQTFDNPGRVHQDTENPMTFDIGELISTSHDATCRLSQVTDIQVAGAPGTFCLIDLMAPNTPVFSGGSIRIADHVPMSDAAAVDAALLRPSYYVLITSDLSAKRTDGVQGGCQVTDDYAPGMGQQLQIIAASPTIAACGQPGE